jgi:ribosomal protein S18 acetylase RimI-like enzyme
MNLDDVRSRLARDAVWAAYPLADLAPAHLPHCHWFTGEDHAIALLYDAFSSPIFWAAGQPDQLRAHFTHLFAAPELILQIQPPFELPVREHYDSVELQPMSRMALNLNWFAPVAGRPSDRRLSLADVPAIEALCADGAAHGEAPGFFFPSMLEQGVFFGAWLGRALVAVAGTHIVSSEERVAAIGNVYTRRDQRRRGHAARLTSAVSRTLLDMGIQTVALSVRELNFGAIALYTRLGFASHCRFFEGHARRHL